MIDLNKFAVNLKTPLVVELCDSLSYSNVLEILSVLNRIQRAFDWVCNGSLIVVQQATYNCFDQERFTEEEKNTLYGRLNSLLNKDRVKFLKEADLPPDYHLLSGGLKNSILKDYASMIYEFVEGETLWGIRKLKECELTVNLDALESFQGTLHVNYWGQTKVANNDNGLLRVTVPESSLKYIEFTIENNQSSCVILSEHERSQMINHRFLSLYFLNGEYFIVTKRVTNNEFSQQNTKKLVPVNRNLLKMIEEAAKTNDNVNVKDSDGKIYSLESTYLAFGGEGKIFQISNDNTSLCKIYTKEMQGKIKNKLEMLSKFNLERISFPTKTIFYHGQFSGYVMPLVNGKSASIVLQLHRLRKKKYTRNDLVSIAKSWIELLIKLHAKGVFIVDMNPQNILVDLEKKEASIVDIDSVQVGEYTCDVGVVDYLSPRQVVAFHEGALKKSSYKDELFSIAITLFMMLMGAKHPMDQISQDSNTYENRYGTFVYPYKKHGKKEKVPKGSYIRLWNRFNDPVKEMFHDIFTLKKNIKLMTILGILTNYQSFLNKKGLNSDWNQLS